MAVLTGIGLGLGTLIFIGPVLFYLIKSAIEGGKRAGIAVALGIIAGDVICVNIALWGSKNTLFTDPIYLNGFAIGGGTLLVAMGLKYIFKPSLRKDVSGKFNATNMAVYFTNGFLINFVNPFVFAVWFGFVSLLQAKFSTDAEVYIALIFTLLTIFTTDSLKALFAHKLTHVLQPETLVKLFKFFGILMISFGVRLLIYPWL